MRRLRVVLLSLLVSGGVLAVPASAQAAGLELDTASGVGSRGSCQAYSDHPVGYACFHADGDYFYVANQGAGTKVVAYWKLTDGSRSGLIRWGVSQQYTLGVKNKNLPEGARVGVRFGVCSNARCDRVSDVNFQGSSWSYTTA